MTGLLRCARNGGPYVTARSEATKQSLTKQSGLSHAHQMRHVLEENLHMRHGFFAL